MRMILIIGILEKGFMGNQILPCCSAAYNRGKYLWTSVHIRGKLDSRGECPRGRECE
jgi:hypothetical protein